jgi:hypothetical protein
MIGIGFRVVAWIAAIAAAASLWNLLHLPFWLCAIAAVISYAVAFFGLSVAAAALAECRFRRLGVPPVDRWPNDAE